MAHHAYLITGDLEKGIEAALTFGERELSLSGIGNPDIIVLRYGLFSVEDARKLSDIASRTALGVNGKLVVVGARRFFHEAQNALLKTFEEPPQGTTLVLVVPSEGVVLPTLRSRLVPLEVVVNEGTAAEEFLHATPAAREKIIAKLLDRAKSDKPEEKQAARAEALSFAEGLAQVAYAAHTKKADPALRAFLADLDRCIPILYERSAPLKPIFEHLLIVAPRTV